MLIKFDGNKEKLFEFVDNCNKAHSLVNVNKHNILFAIIETKITDHARALIRNRQFCNWKELKIHLLEIFSNKRTMGQWQLELNSLRQNSGETILLYSTKIENCYIKLINSLDDSLTGEALRACTNLLKMQSLNAFISGLHKDISILVKSQKPTDQESAVAIALSEEQERKSKLENNSILHHCEHDSNEQLALLTLITSELDKEYSTVIDSILLAKVKLLHPSVINPTQFITELTKTINRLPSGSEYPTPTELENAHTLFDLSKIKSNYNSILPNFNILHDDCCKKHSNHNIDEISIPKIHLNKLDLEELKVASHKLDDIAKLSENLSKTENTSRKNSVFSIIVQIVCAILITYLIFKVIVFLVNRIRNKKNPYDHNNDSRFSEPSRERSLERGKDRGSSKSVCRVYVSNIPYEYRWQDLKDLFREQVGDVSFVELFVDESDKPRGCGIVEFSDSESVKKCLEVMHRFELKGRKLVIKEDFGNQRDKYGNLVGSAASKRARDRDEGRDRFRENRGSGLNTSALSRSSQDLTDGKWGNTYGLSPQFLDTLGVHVPLINRVFVANLDYKVDKKKLKEVFRLAGRIQRIDLSSDKDGKSRGFAVVEFDHPVEAVQTISMFHNHFLYDRVMTVRMDREGDRSIVKLPDGLKGIGMGLGSNGEPLRDVARNLPSLSNISTQSTAAGAGILGPVPSVSLGIGNALSNLNNVGSSALGSLSTNAAVLQAENLAGVGGLSSNLLANTLGGGDLGLASLVQNSSLASLANSGNLGASSLNSSNFNRNELSNNQSGSNYQRQSYLRGGKSQRKVWHLKKKYCQRR
ncbi:hypothetical protein FQA39_LY01373 [Lamprigera yunnana]|nr:hypothetical protein FQA39_LY01373 [Lamprigera yunnana]